MEKVRIGLIGCGRISKNHLDAVSQIPEADFVAVCDTSLEKAKTVAEERDITKIYTDHHEMLAKEELDLVSICTPSGMHPEHGIDVANAGVHVLTEKPMAINITAADKLIKACDENHVHLFVVKQNRLNSTMQLLKQAVDKNRFGRIYMAQANVFWQRPQAYYDQEKWRGTWEFDGGAYMNQASHYVDAMYWLLGNVDSVSAYTATMARNIEAEDTGSAVVHFRNGIIASINVTMLTYPKNFEGSITIIGEKGTVKVGGVAVNKIEKWEFEEYDDDDRIALDSNYIPPNIYGFGHNPYYRNVVDTLLGRAVPSTDGRDGRKSVEIIQAIYRSAKTGKRVSLPL
ncbi:MAG: Gfo/Idh/MocA family oxidoreductase [Candidatus Cloacimonadaceae bacterium]|jgi:UDP-N-acetyl-2-amino-2-deoxyglucuronate dehydrogenase|nr:Gfo/Idh/MocA family oxidoreductase [Candidatus Cloacimonadota bacterium]MDY0126954.1 Gfo/Idh/MocA family oxidoreductase [Candidatus Cloacimonadaceae bacterium]MCB5254998.1 Gfo/Idh/MocA family oxidoreductase [Candidatus Cloacimonadota bacterium]MCK9177583.1 Gfo/Idh/MocA family oxidoreductase [Candidatus Cloacimonadota bacterium]MCK9241808.1 Gfo/Idh/MocA family oxidoreductase [Candidatus Cloacimonadota bacterium]